MKGTSGDRFAGEVNGYFMLVVLNLVFASLAVATGVQYMVSSIISGNGGQGPSGTNLVTAVLSMVCFGLGISWIVASTKILSGVVDIRREWRSYHGEVPHEVLTDLIVRMIAHYRENRRTVNTMRYICLIGGFCFLGLGIIGGLQSASTGPASGSITVDVLYVIPQALIALAIALTSLVSSYRFGQFKESWDQRLEEIGRYEETFEMTLRMDRE